MLLLFFLLILFAAQPGWSFDLTRHSAPIPGLSTGGLPKDAIPAVDDPTFVSVVEADYLELEDRVIGVAIEGEARAYPIRLLASHEIVNDELGKQPLAVTW